MLSFTRGAAARWSALAAALALAGAAPALLAHDDSHRPASAKAAAVGVPGDRAAASRTVVIGMNDRMRFTPDRIAVKRGETIRFVARNDGQLRHEMVIGSLSQLKAHAAEMLKHPGMEHAEPNQVSVEPGKTGELVWRFTSSGVVDFACLQAGHFEAGMVGKVAVR